jgi:hypothetical protein
MNTIEIMFEILIFITGIISILYWLRAVKLLNILKKKYTEYLKGAPNFSSLETVIGHVEPGNTYVLQFNMSNPDAAAQCANLLVKMFGDAGAKLIPVDKSMKFIDPNIIEKEGK